jgi:hypothetical protein
MPTTREDFASAELASVPAPAAVFLPVPEAGFGREKSSGLY